MADPPQETEPVELDATMTVVEINGYDYVGYLSVPKLDLELPVMSDWDYDRLKTVPCRHFGSTKTDDLVIQLSKPFWPPEGAGNRRRRYLHGYGRRCDPL